MNWAARRRAVDLENFEFRSWRVQFGDVKVAFENVNARWRIRFEWLVLLVASAAARLQAEEFI